MPLNTSFYKYIGFEPEKWHDRKSVLSVTFIKPVGNGSLLRANTSESTGITGKPDKQLQPPATEAPYSTNTALNWTVNREVYLRHF